MTEKPVSDNLALFFSLGGQKFRLLFDGILVIMDSETPENSAAPQLMDQWMPPLEAVGPALEMVAFTVIFILLTILTYSVIKYVSRCYKELRRQSDLLEEQTQAIIEMNRWMKYFDDKLIAKENPNPTEKSEEEAQPTPISLYKKTI